MKEKKIKSTMTEFRMNFKIDFRWFMKIESEFFEYYFEFKMFGFIDIGVGRCFKTNFFQN